MLGERRAAILRLIIEYYIKTGEPIGSKTLCNLLPYAVSSATIRNEMAHLSNLGYLGAAPYQRRPCAGQECLPLLCGSPNGA